ncbi:MAG: hypothetical protein Q9228_000089 [Teloschistes exilis]
MPRRSNTSHNAAPVEDGTLAKEKEKSDGVNIERLAKGVLPSNTQIHKDAILAMSKGATVFISHIADKANEFTQSTSRKTISPKAVLDALRECEFAEFLPRVEAELNRFNEINTGKRNEYRRKIKEKETGTVDDAKGGENSKYDVGNGDVDGGISVELDGSGATEQNGERPTKRVRRDIESVGDVGDVKSPQRDRVAVNGSLAASGDELAMDEDDEIGEVEQQFEREGDAGQLDDDVEEEQEDEESDEADEEDVEDDLDGSGLDTNASPRVLREGASSGVDEGSQDESD